MATPLRRQMTFWSCAALVGLLVLGAAAAGQAFPVYRRLAEERYAVAPACEICHSKGGGTERTLFGEAWQRAGGDIKAFVRLDSDDADGDGFSNGAEIRAKSDPNAKTSTPDNPGAFAELKPALLIPKEQLELVVPDARRFEIAEYSLTQAERGQVAAVVGSGPVSLLNAYPTLYFAVKRGQRTSVSLFVHGGEGDNKHALLVGVDVLGKVKAVAIFDAGDDYTGSLYHRYLRCLRGHKIDDLPMPGSPTCVVDEFLQSRAAEYRGSVLTALATVKVVFGG